MDLTAASPLSIAGAPAIKFVPSAVGRRAKSPIRSTPMPPKWSMSSGGGHRHRRRQKTWATCCMRQLTTSSNATPQ
eukprot:6364088-Pyramimonas_sp.AAC.1